MLVNRLPKIFIFLQILSYMWKIYATFVADFKKYLVWATDAAKAADYAFLQLLKKVRQAAKGKDDTSALKTPEK